MVSRFLFFCLFSALFLTACSEKDPVPVQQKEYTYIFFTSLGDQTIERAVIENEQVIETEILYSSIKGLEAPSAIVSDERTEMIYWTDFSTKQILRAPWDGRANPEVLYTVPDQGDGPVELALDPIAQKIFWTQPFDDLILTAPTNGSGPVDTLFSARDGIDGSWGIALQVSEGYLYWIEYMDNEVYRARMDGSHPELLYAGGSGFLSPYGLAISEATGELFIADNPVPGAGQPDRILRGSLDGKKKLEMVYSLTDSVSNAYNIAIDEETGSLYWHNQLSKGSIWRGSLDGNHQPEKLIGNVNIGQGLSVARSTQML